MKRKLFLKWRNETEKKNLMKKLEERRQRESRKQYFTMKYQKNYRIIKQELKEFKMKPLKRSLRGARKESRIKQKCNGKCFM